MTSSKCYVDMLLRANSKCNFSLKKPKRFPLREKKNNKYKMLRLSVYGPMGYRNHSLSRYSRIIYTNRNVVCFTRSRTRFIAKKVQNIYSQGQMKCYIDTCFSRFFNSIVWFTNNFWSQSIINVINCNTLIIVGTGYTYTNYYHIIFIFIISNTKL